MALQPRFQGFQPAPGTTWLADESRGTFPLNPWTSGWGTPGSIDEIIINTDWGVSSAGVIIKQTAGVDITALQEITGSFAMLGSGAMFLGFRFRITSNDVATTYTLDEIPLGFFTSGQQVPLGYDGFISLPNVTRIQYQARIRRGDGAVSTLTMSDFNWRTSAVENQT